MQSMNDALRPKCIRYLDTSSTVLETKHNATNSAIQPINASLQRIEKSPAKEPVSKVLDGFMLLHKCKAKFPEDVEVADLAGSSITEAIAEDLMFFANLKRMDISDNEISLEPFQSLPALVDLKFQCNALRSFTLDQGFQCLEILNLSYNCVTPKGFAQLTKMPNLRELYLASNHVHTIPIEVERFAQIEILCLEFNKLEGSNCFCLLAMIPRLRVLNLSNNKITAIPEEAVICSERTFPFSRLSHLNLANNQITQENCVYPLIHIVTLRQVELYGNPLTDAACVPNDKSELLYDPVRSINMKLAEREKERRPILCTVHPKAQIKGGYQNLYDEVEIYKMVPIQASSPHARRFREAQHSPNSTLNTRTKKMYSSNSGRSKISDRGGKDASNLDDHTFLEGNGIENLLVPLHAYKLKTESTRESSNALAMTQLSPQWIHVPKNTKPLKAKAALNALRYRLSHPVTSHDNDNFSVSQSQKATSSVTHGLHTRKSQNSSVSHAPPRVSSAAAKSIDDALDSFVATAHRITQAFPTSPNGKRA